jgi:hypothetical protein
MVGEDVGDAAGTGVGDSAAVIVGVRVGAAVFTASTNRRKWKCT